MKNKYYFILSPIFLCMIFFSCSESTKNINIVGTQWYWKEEGGRFGLYFLSFTDNENSMYFSSVAGLLPMHYKYARNGNQILMTFVNGDVKEEELTTAVLVHKDTLHFKGIDFIRVPDEEVFVIDATIENVVIEIDGLPQSTEMLSTGRNIPEDAITLCERYLRSINIHAKVEIVRITDYARFEAHDKHGLCLRAREGDFHWYFYVYSRGRSFVDDGNFGLVIRETSTNWSN